jgi:hypothetical protein
MSVRIRSIVLIIASCLVFAALVALPALAQSDEGNVSESSPSTNIYTWNDNTPAWNRKLHVSGYRIGCSSGSQGITDCLGKVQHELDEGQDVRRISIAILNSGEAPSQALADALFASQVSLSKPFLAEVSFDDFGDYYHQLFARRGFSPQSWLEKMIGNIKAKNPALRIGITVYTKQLHSDYAYFKPTDLPSKVAASIDTVYLYPSYQDEAKPSWYPAYVRQTKALFPNAEIVGGSPAYDHVDWGFCSDFGKRRYTPAQEIKLLEELIGIQARLVKEGGLSGIEFYPGHFGKESEWGGWKSHCVCHANRVQQCIEDTRTMREYAEKTLQSTLGW